MPSLIGQDQDGRLWLAAQQGLRQNSGLLGHLLLFCFALRVKFQAATGDFFRFALVGDSLGKLPQVLPTPVCQVR